VFFFQRNRPHVAFRFYLRSILLPGTSLVPLAYFYLDNLARSRFPFNPRKAAVFMFFDGSALPLRDAGLVRFVGFERHSRSPRRNVSFFFSTILNAPCLWSRVLDPLSVKRMELSCVNWVQSAVDEPLCLREAPSFSSARRTLRWFSFPEV